MLFVDQQTDAPSDLGCAVHGCERPAYEFAYSRSRSLPEGFATACQKHARKACEDAAATQSREYPVSVFTGPCLVHEVAARLGSPALAGTERVYFTVQACSRDEAHMLALESVRKLSKTFLSRDVAVSSAR
jgi:hypothetical protein